MRSALEEEMAVSLKFLTLEELLFLSKKTTEKDIPSTSSRSVSLI